MPEQETTLKLSDLQREEAAYLAANWKAIPRSQRRAVVRFWWKTGVRFADTFGQHWNHVRGGIIAARPTI